MIPAAVAPAAHARDHSEHRTLRQMYSDFYFAVRRRHGRRAPGRNIRRHGVKTSHGVRSATSRELARSIRTFRRWLRPAPIVPTVAASTPTVAASVAQPVTGGMPACTWKPESGGSYTAVNPSSGAFGKYQIVASTWAAYCTGISRDPGGQETCARRVLAGQGAGAWVNC